jgi:putative FmdB family regulatory protein
MPIFEYECRGCGHQFELLVLPNREQAAACPECQGKELEKLIPSTFGFSSAEIAQERVQKARALYKASKDVKDKKIAEAEHIREHVSEHQERVRNETK